MQMPSVDSGTECSEVDVISFVQPSAQQTPSNAAKAAITTSNTVASALHTGESYRA